MYYLILAIVFATCNQLTFKAIAHFKIDLLSAIVANYVVCIGMAYFSSVEPVFQNTFLIQKWFPYSIIQGIIFISCLFFMGKTTEKQGVAIATLSARLSVVIPIIAAFLLFGDIITLQKAIGILAALLALYLSSYFQYSKSHSFLSFGVLPFVLFIAFGAHSTLLKFVQDRYLDSSSYNIYIMSSFLSALVLSGSGLVFRIYRGRHIIRSKDLFWGFMLGFINYGAVYFLLRTLSIPGRESSQLFPTISIAVLGLSSFGAWSIFKEQMGLKIVGAITIGAISIVLININ